MTVELVVRIEETEDNIQSRIRYHTVGDRHTPAEQAIGDIVLKLINLALEERTRPNDEPSGEDSSS